MGLIAGVSYIFACCVMPALARRDDRFYVEVTRNNSDVIQAGCWAVRRTSAQVARTQPVRSVSPSDM